MQKMCKLLLALFVLSLTACWELPSSITPDDVAKHYVKVKSLDLPKYMNDGSRLEALSSTTAKFIESGKKDGYTVGFIALDGGFFSSPTVFLTHLPEENIILLYKIEKNSVTALGLADGPEFEKLLEKYGFSTGFGSAKSIKEVISFFKEVVKNGYYGGDRSAPFISKDEYEKL
jgi:hypothetical protein